MEEKDKKEQGLKAFLNSNNLTENVVAIGMIGEIFQKNFPDGVEITFEKLIKILALVKSIEIFLNESPREIPNMEKLEEDILNIFNDETTIKA